MEINLQNILDLFTNTYELSGWVLFLLGLFTLVGLITLLKKIFKKRNSNSYKEDMIYAVTWRWKWRKENIYDLHAYCPDCEDMLVYDDSPCTSSPKKETHFICQHCDQIKTTIPGGNNNYAISIIKREINRRIRMENNK